MNPNKKYTIKHTRDKKDILLHLKPMTLKQAQTFKSKMTNYPNLTNDIVYYDKYIELLHNQLDTIKSKCMETIKSTSIQYIYSNTLELFIYTINMIKRFKTIDSDKIQSIIVDIVEPAIIPLNRIHNADVKDYMCNSHYIIYKEIYNLFG